MNVLYVVFQALLGGHVLSAKTIAHAMKARGIQPAIAGSSGPMVDEIRRFMPFDEVKIPIYHGTAQTYFTWKSLEAIRELRQVVRDRRINLIHAFDARSYFHAYPAGLLEKIPVICTLCGGVDPYYNVPLAPCIIVFSEEQKQKLVQTYKWPEESVEVIRTRLDMKEILAEDSLLTKDEAKEYGLSADLPKIVLISRFDDTKIKSLRCVLESIECVFQRGTPCQMVIIGGDGAHYAQLLQLGEQICCRFGRGKIVFTGTVLKAFRLLQQASLVLGVGRSAFEGMAYGKPVLIVGEGGYAGTVNEDTIQQIAYFNFSGRNQTQAPPPELLANEICRLLRDADERERLGRFGREFAMREIDVERGTDRIAQIYGRASDAASRLPIWRQWLSFYTCLGPIARDNGLHSLRRLLRAGTGAVSLS